MRTSRRGLSRAAQAVMGGCGPWRAAYAVMGGCGPWCAAYAAMRGGARGVARVRYMAAQAVMACRAGGDARGVLGGAGPAG